MRNLGPEKPDNIIFNLPNVVSLLFLLLVLDLSRLIVYLIFCSNVLFPSLASKVIFVLVPTLQKGGNESL